MKGKAKWNAWLSRKGEELVSLFLNHCNIAALCNIKKVYTVPKYNLP